MPQTEWLKPTEIYCLTGLEAQSLKSGWQQGHVPSETSWNLLPHLFLAPGGVPAIFRADWLTTASLQFTCHSLYDWLIRTQVALDQGLALFHYDLVLNNHICIDPISKQSHILTTGCWDYNISFYLGEEGRTQFTVARDYTWVSSKDWTVVHSHHSFLTPRTWLFNHSLALPPDILPCFL